MSTLLVCSMENYLGYWVIVDIYCSRGMMGLTYFVESIIRFSVNTQMRPTAIYIVNSEVILYPSILLNFSLFNYLRCASLRALCVGWTAYWVELAFDYNLCNT